MVVGAFPVFKLGALFLKHLSKPLANAVKTRAKNSPFFRNYICMPPAQFYHWAEVKMKMWSMNLGKPVNIPKLNEALAIDLGAELLGEGIIFGIAAGILTFEYVRSSRKEEAKEEARIAEMTQIQNDLRDLYLETAKQDAQIKELVRILHVRLPEATYSPKPFSKSLIPEHHREEYHVEEAESLYSSLKGWVWSAMEYIVPEKDEKSVGSSNQKTSEDSQTILRVIPSEVIKSSSSQDLNAKDVSSNTPSTSKSNKD